MKKKILILTSIFTLTFASTLSACNNNSAIADETKEAKTNITKTVATKTKEDTNKNKEETKEEETTVSVAEAATEVVAEANVEIPEYVEDYTESYVEPTYEEEYVPEEVYTPTTYYHLQGVPMIYQNAEGLPAGCEGTSLTMALQYAGVPVSAWDTCINYMPHTFDSTDIENVFIGDPNGCGYGCYVGCVMTTANNIISAYGAGVSAHNLTGDLNGMYNTIMSGYPVVIWGTDGWGDPNWGTYYSNTGAFTWWSNEHCLLLVGFTDNTVIIHDPYRGVVEIDRALFEYEWVNCGSRAVAVY